MELYSNTCDAVLPEYTVQWEMENIKKKINIHRNNFAHISFTSFM